MKRSNSRAVLTLGLLTILSLAAGCSASANQSREDYEKEVELRRQQQMSERQDRELEDIRRQKRQDDLYLRRY